MRHCARGVSPAWSERAVRCESPFLPSYPSPPPLRGRSLPSSPCPRRMTSLLPRLTPRALRAPPISRLLSLLCSRYQAVKRFDEAFLSKYEVSHLLYVV